MDQTKKKLSTAKTVHEFSVSRLNFARHTGAVILTTLLCFSLVMSEWTRFNQTHQTIFTSRMLPIYLILVLFSLLMTAKAIVSVKQIKISKIGIEISNLFWHEKLDWKDLNAFKAPKNLRFSWLKTKRSFYLFIKGEFKDYEALESQIAQYLPIET